MWSSHFIRHLIKIWRYSPKCYKNTPEWAHSGCNRSFNRAQWIWYAVNDLRRKSAICRTINLEFFGFFQWKQQQNILETTLGIDIQSQNEGDSEFLHKAHDILDITARRFFQPWIQPKLLFQLSKHAKPFYSGVDYLNKLLVNVSIYALLQIWLTKKCPSVTLFHLHLDLAIRNEKSRIRKGAVIPK